MLAFLCALFGGCVTALAPPPAPPPPMEHASPAVVQADPGAPALPDSAEAGSALPSDEVAATRPPAGAPVARPTAGQPEIPAWRRFAVAAAAAGGRPTLSIIIDDMGLNRPQSERAIALPAPVTLSWMPYAADLPEQVADGAAHGHEAMLHMPMEPLGRTNPGPNALRTWVPEAANLASLRSALDAVPNAVGLNQHEGSVASLSVPLMDLVMTELHERGMLFIDSMTIAHSVALGRAQAAGVPSLPRDVFLDNDANPGAIRAQLVQAENAARKYGHAIAIGHPRPATMDVLTQYLPTEASRGIVLWPVSAAVAAENQLVLVSQPAQ